MRNIQSQLKGMDARWLDGDPHDHRSEQIYKFLREVDNGYFDWREGGDGDNGEELMYQLDMYFEAVDKGLVDA